MRRWRTSSQLGERSLASGESVSGARRFADGVGRHGAFPADT
jgi:hypothetical protein